MKEIKVEEHTIKVYFDGELGRDLGGEIYIQHESFCEHCMELEPYSLMFPDGGTTWCEVCAECIEDEALEVLLQNEKAMKLLEKMAIEEKIKYFQGRIDALKKELVSD